MIARFAIRPDSETTPAGKRQQLLLLGMIDVSMIEAGLMKPGYVYEITLIATGFSIREVGISAATPNTHPEGACWHRDVSGLVIDGRHLRTVEEDARQHAAEMEEYYTNKWWKCDELTREQKDRYRAFQNEAEKKAGNNDYIFLPRPADIPQGVSLLPETSHGQNQERVVYDAIDRRDFKEAERLLAELRKERGGSDTSVVRMDSMICFEESMEPREEEIK